MLVVLGNDDRYQKSRRGPSAISKMRFKTCREPADVRNKSRKKETAVTKEDFNCFKEGERKKAKKSNTSKGTMNVESNGTKPFLQLQDVLFLFPHVLKVVVVEFHFDES